MDRDKLTLQDCFKYPNARISEMYPMDNYVYSNLTDKITDLIKNDEIIFPETELTDCRLILRSIDELTEEEKNGLKELCEENWKMLVPGYYKEVYLNFGHLKCFDYLRNINIDIDGFIDSGKAVKQ